MSYARAKSVVSGAIPVIDVGGIREGSPATLERVGAELRRASEEIGFFYIRNHGIAQSLIDQVFAEAHRFFRCPLDEKNQVAVNEVHHGFIRVGEAKMYDTARADLKESFVWGLDVGEDDPDYRDGRPLIGPNRWPAFQPDMRDRLVCYFEACNALGWALFRALAASLGEPAERFVAHIDKPLTRASIIYYPPQPADLGSEQFGVAPHTDFGCLTLLCQDGTGGLQVKDRNGDWVTARPVEGAFVVNIGDLMARWTNDRFTSTEHRVVNSSGRERFSVGVFVDPNYETPIDPVVRPGDRARHEAIRCGDYISWRLGRSFDYRNSTKDQDATKSP